MNEKIESKELIIGLITWILCMVWGISGSACVKSGACGGWDLLINAFVAIGCLVPAYFVATIISPIIFSEKKQAAFHESKVLHSQIEAVHKNNPDVGPVVKKPIVETNQAEQDLYGISYDGERYCFRSYKYDRLQDAINYAKLVKAKDDMYK